MDSTILLCIGALITTVSAYYLFLGLFKLIEQLAKNSGQSLKAVFILLGLSALTYITINRSRSDELLAEVKDQIVFWEEPLADSGGEVFDWE